MLTNNELKYYSSLNSKKFRKLENKFLAEGKRLVSELLNSSYEIEIVFFTENFEMNNAEFIRLIKGSKIKSEIVKEKDFKKLCDTLSPQGIVAVVKSFLNTKTTIEEKLIVALESISDPGNLGTILRNSDWFGIKTIILSENCAEVFNPKVLRSSMGAVFHLNIIESSRFVFDLRELYKDYNILTADMNGQNLYESSINEKSILVMCNEANGPSKELLEITNTKLTIPKLGSVESLNVASASAVLLAELTK
ncbi:MAG: RNA methyltransferase [Melioribacteraceae bacterium]|nr:RNA methyltransferase [Melioribacteraceae bacterium]